MLGYPHPCWRQDLTYPLLARRINCGVFDNPRAGIGDGIAAGARNTSALPRALRLQFSLGVQGRAELHADAEQCAKHPANRTDLVVAVLAQIRARAVALSADGACTRHRVALRP